MTQMSNKVTDQRGIILTDNVDLDWLNSLTPRFHSDYVKFVIDTKTNRVVVGMDVHADAQALLGADEDTLYGGNIYRDGHIVYSSTLNVDKSLSAKKKPGLFQKLFHTDNSNNPRIVTNKDIIEQINAVLFAWVKI